MGSQGPGHAIFISYRREDTSGYADRVFKALNKRGLFEDKVFIDVDNLAPGDDFVRAIGDKLDACDVLIALIGSHWLTPRLDDPLDYVRQEIKTALDRGIKVIPVLVDKASMPKAEQLPDDLKRLARRNAVELDRRHWDADLQSLVRALRKVIRPETAAARLSRAAGRAWGWIKGPLRRRLVQGLKAALFVVPTLILPNTFILWALTQGVASYYRRFGRVEYTITDPATHIQLALIQSTAVFIYSGIWLAAYRRLRRRRDAQRPQADADKPRDTPRTE
jgi:TIR domain